MSKSLNPEYARSERAARSCTLGPQHRSLRGCPTFNGVYEAQSNSACKIAKRTAANSIDCSLSFLAIDR